MNNGKYVYRLATMTTDTGDTGQLDTVGDVAQVSVEDLENVNVFLNQLTDNGTITLIVDYSLDGVNWVTGVATKAETDFAAGANEAEATLSLTDANGASIPVKLIRVRCTVATGTGGYTMGVTGRQTTNYRG